MFKPHVTVACGSRAGKFTSCRRVLTAKRCGISQPGHLEANETLLGRKT